LKFATFILFKADLIFAKSFTSFKIQLTKGILSY
jgi:hypothetical protein